MVNRILLATLIIVAACNSNTKNPVSKKSSVNPQIIINDTVSNFFPVTSFLKGEIYGIKTSGITPIKRTYTENQMDSVFLKETEFENNFSEFLSPIIDTSNLKNSFVEKRFLDETLNAFTFTYDPADGTKNSFAFTHWDVYVDPETNKVRRIYITKKVDEETKLLMTWQSGKWCEIITIKKEAIMKKEKISWSYEE